MNDVSSEDEFCTDPRKEREAEEAALRAALHFHVGEVCSAETAGKAMTGAAVSTLAEVVFKYTEALALDLRVFAKHGKRAVVGVDDVKCVARKDPKMVEKLASFEAAHLSLNKKKARKTKKDRAEGPNAVAPRPNEARNGKDGGRPQLEDTAPRDRGLAMGCMHEDLVDLVDDADGPLGEDPTKIGSGGQDGHIGHGDGDGDYDDMLL